MTKQEMKNRITELTGLVQQTGFPQRMIEAAQTGDSKKVEEAFDAFKKENPDLFQDISQNFATMSFYAIYEENEDFDGVDPLAFYALIFLSERKDDGDLFDDMDIVTDALKEKGYDELANHLEFYWPEYPCYGWLAAIYAKQEDEEEE